jgi:hypothetical protein
VNRFRVLAVACCLVLPAIAADARPASKSGGACASPEQVKAAQLRQLHDQLQVAALNCRGEDATLHAKWGSYVGRFGSTLSDNARVLRTHFKTPAAFDRYNTEVTNFESVRVHETEQYCETRAQMFEKVMTMSPAQFANFAAETVGRPSHVNACPAPTTREAKASKPPRHPAPNAARTAQAN